MIDVRLFVDKWSVSKRGGLLNFLSGGIRIDSLFRQVILLRMI